MEICIAGDFCARERVTLLIDNGEFELFDDVKSSIKKEGLNIINLEAPLVVPQDNIKKGNKTGPIICQTPKSLDAIQYLGFNCVTLANNHFRDYGDDGCLKTIEQIDERKIMRVGGGKNLDEALEILYFSEPDYIPESTNKSQIAIINVCENEYSIATKSRPGSAPLKEVSCYHLIKEAKEKAEIVIVIVHGGIEQYQYPTPRMVELYRWFVEIGADVVVNHHQHCFSGYEAYRRGMIFYGLGNFCFDWAAQRNKSWSEGYLVKLCLKRDKPIKDSFEIVPYVQCEGKAGVRLMSELEKKRFEDNLHHINDIIIDNKSLRRTFEDYVSASWPKYKGWISPYMNRYLLSLCRKGFLPIFKTRKKMMLITNLTRCESHREELIEILEQKTLMNTINRE